MRHNTVFVILLLLLFLPGCRMIKETTRINEESTLENQNDIKEASQVKVSEQAKETTNSQVNTSEETIEETAVILWSPPDSVGKQYPLQTSTTVKRKKSTTKAAINTNKDNESNTESNSSKEDKTRQKTNTAVKIEAVTKPVTATWKIWLAIIIPAGLLILLYFVLKRYKIIK